MWRTFMLGSNRSVRPADRPFAGRENLTRIDPDSTCGARNIQPFSIWANRRPTRARSADLRCAVEISWVRSSMSSPRCKWFVRSHGRRLPKRPTTAIPPCNGSISTLGFAHRGRPSHPVRPNGSRCQRRLLGDGRGCARAKLHPTPAARQGTDGCTQASARDLIFVPHRVQHPICPFRPDRE